MCQGSEPTLAVCMDHRVEGWPSGGPDPRQVAFETGARRVMLARTPYHVPSIQPCSFRTKGQVCDNARPVASRRPLGSPRTRTGVLVALLVMVACAAPVMAGSAVCTARSTVPHLHTEDRRECASWPTALLGTDESTTRPLPAAGHWHTTDVCSVEVVHGVTSHSDADADLSVCDLIDCPYKWAYSVNFVGEVLLFRVLLATTNSDVVVAFRTPAATQMHVLASWATTPTVQVDVTAGCVVSTSGTSADLTATGSGDGQGLQLTIPNSALQNDFLYIAVVATGDFSASSGELLSQPVHVSVDVYLQGESTLVPPRVAASC